MSNRQKISQFSGLTALDDSDLLTVVANNQNFKISVGDFKTLLGVTGTIESIGDTLGTAILQQVGDQYQIRRATGSNGVFVGTTSENGLSISNSFQNGAGGQGVIVDPNANIIKFRSLVSGTGIDVTTTGENLQISSTALKNFSYLSMAENATATTVSDGTAVKVAGIFTDEASEGFTNDATGKATYTRSAQLKPSISCNFSYQKSGAGSGTYKFYLAKNGTVINGTAYTSTTETAANVSIAAILDLAQNDFLELFVEGVGTTDAITVSSFGIVIDG
jgi:hypothetical protein